MSERGHGTPEGDLTCMRRRNIGKSANDCTENKINPNTDRSSGNREARTTEDDIAAFMDKTEVSLLTRSERS